MESIKVVELFAGVGGFRLGLETASSRFQTVWANQWEPSMREQYAYDCYVTHFGHSSCHVCKDIAVAKADIPDHDLLVGGFPCQDYSIAKKGSKGLEGEKGALWWQIDTIISAKQPQYILLENVDHLLRSPAKQKGRDFSIILRCFYENGYAVEWRVVNAADYGQAQRRRRTFILAYRNNTDRFKALADTTCIMGLKGMHRWVMEGGVFSQAFPLSGHDQNYSDTWLDEYEYETLQDIAQKHRAFFHPAGVMMNGRAYSVEAIPQREPFTPLHDVLETKPVDPHYFLRKEDMARWSYAKGPKREARRRRDGSTYVFTEGTVAFPDPIERPSRTMLTSESQVGRTSHVVRDLSTGQLRILTPIECERLNGFPDGWTDTGMPERMRYFVTGNALVVPLITRLGAKLLQDF